MSHLRAPAARTDRPEGGRHGRPGTRPASAPGRNAPSPGRDGRLRSAPPGLEARIRPQFLRTAILPTVVAALSGAAAVVYTIHAGHVHPSSALRGALTGFAVLAVAAIASAALGADRIARSVLSRCNALRRTSARSQADLRAVVDQLRRGEGPPVRRAQPPNTTHGDAFDLLSQELGRAHEVAVASVVQAAQLSSSAGDEQKVEVFVNLARRLQSLVHREIQLLDELENQVEDPELLKGLFHVDHLATRIRRHAENLAVLGGAISRRQWSNPVSMTEVLRSAIAEVEQYPRVKLVPPIDGTLRGHAVADVIHLLAELVENATVFSAPHTQVLLRAQHVTSGLAVEVEDRGLGMSVTETNKMNALLADPDQVNVGHLLRDGRIGLYVVSALARRHGISVRLQTNIYGGVQAVLILPAGLLGTDQEGLPQAAGAGVPPPAPAPAFVPVPAPAPVPFVPAQSAPPQPAQLPEPVAVHTALPVRDTQGERPNPAAALPGVHHGPRPDHDTTETVAAAPHLPAGSRPLLPRRRSQENLVPQLKEAPVPRRDDEHPEAHDPGLMAAFQRGISLAEAEPVAQPVQPLDNDTFKE
ncbi:ATP-binding protein [Streptomyces sp. NPDC050738]|uniref:sensor histidine kinase n=1 Tax=Streptomyces sp. NPDC050738 TaxID=3154744 RepID=UPI0034317772